MVCPSCGMRQVPRTPYCEQCLCPVAALMPPRTLSLRHSRPQRLPVWPRRQPDARLLLGGAALGVLLGWLPSPVGALGCLLAVVLASVALSQLRRCRRPHVPLWMAWVVMLLGAATSVPASAMLLG